MSAEGITVKKCLVFHMLRNVSTCTRLGKCSVPGNTTRDKTIYRLDQPVELELLRAHGDKYHAIIPLVHAADKAGVGVYGKHRFPLHVKTVGALAQQLSRHGW